jgi:hypothetical protein
LHIVHIASGDIPHEVGRYRNDVGERAAHVNSGSPMIGDDDGNIGRSESLTRHASKTQGGVAPGLGKDVNLNVPSMRTPKFDFDGVLAADRRLCAGDAPVVFDVGEVTD